MKQTASLRQVTVARGSAIRFAGFQRCSEEILGLFLQISLLVLLSSVAGCASVDLAQGQQSDKDLLKVSNILQEASNILSEVYLQKVPDNDRGHFVRDRSDVSSAIIKAQVRAGDYVGALRSDAISRQPGSKEKIDRVQEDKAGTAYLRATATMGRQYHNSACFEAVQLAHVAYEQSKLNDDSASKTLQNAIQAANSLDIGCKSIALVAVARVQAENGHREASSRTFQQCLQAATALGDDLTRIDRLIVIAKAQAQSGDQSNSQKTFLLAIQICCSGNSFERGSNLDPRSSRNYALGRIALAQVLSGDRTAGRQTFHQAVLGIDSIPSHLRSRHLVSIGDWQVEAGEQQAVIETLQEGLQHAKTIKSDTNRDGVLQGFAALAARAGHIEMALAILDSIKTDFWKSVGMREIDKALVKMTSRQEAVSTIQKLSQEASTFLGREDPNNSVLLDSIVVVKAAAGDLQAALQIANSVTDVSAQRFFYSEIVDILLEKDDVAKAKQAASGIKPDWMNDYDIQQVLLKLVTALARAGDVKDALALARAQQRPLAKAKALLAVANGIMDCKRVEGLTPLFSNEGLWSDNRGN